jgi:hypothetical protein
MPASRKSKRGSKRSCKYGRKASGGCKKKPGPKRGSKRSRKSRKSNGSKKSRKSRKAIPPKLRRSSRSLMRKVNLANHGQRLSQNVNALLQKVNANRLSPSGRVSHVAAELQKVAAERARSLPVALRGPLPPPPPGRRIGGSALPLRRSPPRIPPNPHPLVAHAPPHAVVPPRMSLQRPRPPPPVGLRAPMRASEKLDIDRGGMTDAEWRGPDWYVTK